MTRTFEIVAIDSYHLDCNRVTFVRHPVSDLHKFYYVCETILKAAAGSILIDVHRITPNSINKHQNPALNSNEKKHIIIHIVSLRWNTSKSPRLSFFLVGLTSGRQRGASVARHIDPWNPPPHGAPPNLFLKCSRRREAPRDVGLLSHYSYCGTKTAARSGHRRMCLTIPMSRLQLLYTGIPERSGGERRV